MTRKGQFDLGSKDAHIISAVTRFVTEDKGRLGKMHFPSNALHLRGGQIVCVQDNRKLVARILGFRENIDDEIGMGHFSGLQESPPCCPD